MTFGIVPDNRVVVQRSAARVGLLVGAAVLMTMIFQGEPAQAFLSSSRLTHWQKSPHLSATTGDEIGQDRVGEAAAPESREPKPENKKKKVVIIGAGWGGLSTAYALSSQTDTPLDITVVDASPKVGGLVRDGFQTLNGKIEKAEAGQHGFWDNYHNIFRLLDTEIPAINPKDILTGYAEQGQYSPDGLEAVWPVYRQQSPQLPTGLAQALYTRFQNLPAIDRVSAAPLVLAFSEFDDSPEAWARYDSVSFRDLCVRLGVSKRCYDEAFEPMILTGLFAPGAECSAAAALGMAYFFVLKSQNSFDVRWCKGNIGEKIFRPWVEHMENKGGNQSRQSVEFLTSTRVVGFEKCAESGRKISKVLCETSNGSVGDGKESSTQSVVLDSDEVVFAVGGAALGDFVRYCPVLAEHAEFRRFPNLRGTGVLATRLYLDTFVDTPYSANACWGFDEGVGMTFFDITKLHGLSTSEDNESERPSGSVIEVDYYHAASLLVMDDKSIVEKAKADLDTMLGRDCKGANVLDAAVVKLPRAVNWYSPGSYANMPDARSNELSNVLFAGDLVRSRHGSWSQEKAFVTGIEAANEILNRRPDYGIIPLDPEEFHVALGRNAVSAFRTLLGGGDPKKGPSLVDFLW
mmetsp:Transcript_5387/g.13535  ORF Transcript_5387/g.13535 Transcript_5387/m.13535 type:complete len:632 (+) Transcript_5387:158-2053(+)